MLLALMVCARARPKLYMHVGMNQLVDDESKLHPIIMFRGHLSLSNLYVFAMLRSAQLLQ